MENLNIEILPLTSLAPYANNARTHSKKQIRQIADSIKEFGWTNPVLIDVDGGVIAGHGRLEAAKLLGIDQVPTIRLEDLTEGQKRAYVIADNKLAEQAGWDIELLATEFEGLIEIDIDLELTGFEAPEIDLILAANDDTIPPDEVDEIPAPDLSAPAVSRLGDLWLLGDHRLYCGDATDPFSYESLLGDEKAQLVFTDPPYNVPVSGHVSGLGKAKHREFAMASGEMTDDGFTAFLKSVADNMVTHSVDGSIHFICMDWRHAANLLSAGHASYTEFKNLCVWNKSNAGMGSLYRSRHELVFVFKNGNASHINNVELGKHGRYRTNVWNYAGANTFSKTRDEDLALHPTVKPVALVADALLDCSKRNGLVLDPFSGSGTTIMAADRTGRRAAVIELDPLYVDVAIRRYEKHTGKVVHLSATGATFAETAGARLQLKGVA